MFTDTFIGLCADPHKSQIQWYFSMQAEGEVLDPLQVFGVALKLWIIQQGNFIFML
jgi:hypothetical protein